MSTRQIRPLTEGEIGMLAAVTAALDSLGVVRANFSTTDPQITFSAKTINVVDLQIRMAFMIDELKKAPEEQHGDR